MARQSVGSLSSVSGYSSAGSFSGSVDASFSSLGSSASGGSASYELESEVGREALREICCSVLSRILDFPDSHLETLLGFDEDEGGREDESGMNVARWIWKDFQSMGHQIMLPHVRITHTHIRNIAASLRQMRRSISTGFTALSHVYHHRHNIQELRESSPG